MDNPRPANVAVVDEVRRRFEDADGAILTEYRGLKVKDLAGLRRSLRPSGGEYKIYKNTLVRLAARESGLEDLEPLLVGPTAIAFVDGDAGGGGQSAPRLRPDQSAAGPQGRGARQQDSDGPGDRGPGGAALPGGAARSVRRAAGGTHAAARRAVASPTPELRLRPGCPPRPEGRGLRCPRPGGRLSRTRSRTRNRHPNPNRNREARPRPSRPTARLPKTPHPPSSPHGELRSWQPKKRSSTASPT